MDENQDIHNVQDAATITQNNGDADIMPQTTAVGNEYIKVRGHRLILKEGHKDKAGRGVSMDIENLTGGDIGKIIFKVKFYNEKNELLEEIEPVMTDFGKNKARTIYILSSKASGNNIMGYEVKVEKVFITPAPVATGSNSIQILSHSLRDPQNNNPRGDPQTIIDVAIRNISDKKIATVVFDAVYYDAEGNILDTLRHREIEINPKSSRAIYICSQKAHPLAARSYKVTVVKAVTADTEKVHLYTHEVRTAESGQEEVRGILKNISNVITDAALVACFRDA